MYFLRDYFSLKRCIISLFLIAQFSAYSQADSEEGLVTINMRDADIGAVIQWMAEQTNKKIVLDPRVKGKVTVLANQPMTTDQAYDVFLAMLDIYGYAASETGGILRIFPASMAKSSASDVVDRFNRLGTQEQVVYIIRAENISATKLAELLQPLIATSGYIKAFPEQNSIVLADDGQNVKRLAKLSRELDRAGSMSFETIKLNHASAKETVGVVESLLQGVDQNAFSIASDERSNSILMSGDPATRKRVNELLLQLDQPMSSSGNTKVVYLKYLQAKELVPILQGMSNARNDAGADAAAGKDVSIEASESANALILSGPPALLASMESVIAQVDIRRSQVLVEAIIVEVSQDYAQTIGVEWNTNLDSVSGTGREAATNFGLKTIDPDTGDVLLAGAGLNLGFFKNGTIRGLIQALASETQANILSTPSIVTLDNQEAEILVGSNIPIRTGISTSQASSTDNPFTTIERQDIGLSLKITPQINTANSITLDILQEIETLTQSALVTEDVVTDKRSVKTKVIVKDDAILVLGGLVSDDTRTIERKVPLLGDIPLVGQLFRSTTDQKTKRNLMIFIHPVIVDDQDVAADLSRDKFDLMSELRKQYSNNEVIDFKTDMDDFTTYKPRQADLPE